MQEGRMKTTTPALEDLIEEYRPRTKPVRVLDLKDKDAARAIAAATGWKLIEDNMFGWELRIPDSRIGWGYRRTSLGTYLIEQPDGTWEAVPWEVFHRRYTR